DALEHQAVREAALDLRVERVISMAAAVDLLGDAGQVGEAARLADEESGARDGLIDIERIRHLAPAGADVRSPQPHARQFLLEGEVPVLRVGRAEIVRPGSGNTDTSGAIDPGKRERPLHE